MKKELSVAVIAIGLAAAFVVVSALVWFTRNSPYWLKKKLRIGALLLTLTAAPGCGPLPGETTCYLIAAENEITLDGGESMQDGSYRTVIRVNLAQQQVLTGSILGRTFKAFSFRLLDAQETEVQRGPITASDGTFDDENENIEITLSQDLELGLYRLDLYLVAVDELYQNLDDYRGGFWVEIVREPTE